MYEHSHSLLNGRVDDTCSLGSGENPNELPKDVDRGSPSIP